MIIDYLKFSWLDANVYISLFGDKGKVERRHLRESVDKKRDLFEAGSIDRFQIVELDVGTVRRKYIRSFLLIHRLKKMILR